MEECFQGHAQYIQLVAHAGIPRVGWKYFTLNSVEHNF
jgi:hypothetical protein